MTIDRTFLKKREETSRTVSRHHGFSSTTPEKLPRNFDRHQRGTYREAELRSIEKAINLPGEAATGQAMPMEQAFSRQTDRLVTGCAAVSFVRDVRVEEKGVSAAGTIAIFFGRIFKIACRSMALDGFGGKNRSDFDDGKTGRDEESREDRRREIARIVRECRVNVRRARWRNVRRGDNGTIMCDKAGIEPGDRVQVGRALLHDVLPGPVAEGGSVFRDADGLRSASRARLRFFKLGLLQSGAPGDVLETPFLPAVWRTLIAAACFARSFPLPKLRVFFVANALDRSLDGLADRRLPLTFHGAKHSGAAGNFEGLLAGGVQTETRPGMMVAATAIVPALSAKTDGKARIVAHDILLHYQR